MGGGKVEAGNHIFTCGTGPLNPLTPMSLGTIQVNRVTFDITGMGNRYHHLFLLDKVFWQNLFRCLNYFRTPIITILLKNLLKLVPDNIHYQFLVG